LNSDHLFSNQKQASFTKAIYVKPDLMEIAKCNRANFTPAQLSMLFNILITNNEVFKGGCRHHNREPIGLNLKDDAKTFCTKHYPTPLNNREVIKHKLD
jgi:hypothetical protein